MERLGLQLKVNEKYHDEFATVKLEDLSDYVGKGYEIVCEVRMTGLGVVGGDLFAYVLKKPDAYYRVKKPVRS